MILSIGIDILEKSRIKRFYNLYKFKFLRRILSNYEFFIFLKKKKKIELVSKIFCSKEAILKSFNCGLRNNISFNNISIFNNFLGKPYVKNLNHINIFISISHEKNLTIVIIMLF